MESPGALPCRGLVFQLVCHTRHTAQSPQSGPRWSPAFKIEPVLFPPSLQPHGWTVAFQARLFMGFFRQEHWSGLSFPFPMHEKKSESEVAQSWPILCDPMDYSLPCSSVHGILQARVLKWVAIAFSDEKAGWWQSIKTCVVLYRF